jgi:hypothetical protein
VPSETALRMRRSSVPGRSPVESSTCSPNRNRSIATALLSCQGEGVIEAAAMQLYLTLGGL